MPDYDYKCKKYDTKFTVTKSMSDASTPCCPVCEENTEVNRVWTRVNCGGLSKTSAASGSSSCGSCSSRNCSSCG